MAQQVPYFLRLEGNELKVNIDAEVVFFIPEEYFDKKIAVIQGETVDCIGVCNYAIYVDGKVQGGLKNFYYPTNVSFKPADIETKKNIRLTKTDKPGDFKLLKFYKDDTVIVSIKTPQLVVNVENFFRLFMTGKLPTNIEYNKVHEYFIKNFQLNGGKFGITAQMLGVIVSEAYRDPKDISIPFRLSGEKDMTNYTMIGTKQIPKFISPFTAITSENWDESVVNAVINKNHQDSPLEKLFTI